MCQLLKHEEFLTKNKNTVKKHLSWGKLKATKKDLCVFGDIRIEHCQKV